MKYNEINAIFDRLHSFYGVSSISDLAIKMNTTQPTISNWKSRNSITAIKKRCRELGIYDNIFDNINITYNIESGNNPISHNEGTVHNTFGLVNNPKGDLFEEYKKIETLAQLPEQKEFVKNELKKIKTELLKYYAE